MLTGNYEDSNPGGGMPMMNTTAGMNMTSVADQMLIEYILSHVQQGAQISANIKGDKSLA